MDTFYSMNDGAWPFVHILITRNPADIDEIHEFLDACRTNLYKNERGAFVLYVEPRGLSTLNLSYLYRLVHFMKEIEPLTKQNMIELGLHIRSSIARRIIDCIKALKTPVVPWRIFSTQTEVDEWILELEDRQIIFPI
jgi:hypothetical protein